MNTRRLITFLLLLVQAATAVIMHNAYLLPPTLAALAFVGMWGRYQFDISRDRRAFIGFAVFVAATLSWRLNPDTAGSVSVVFFNGAGLAFIYGFMALQTLQLFYETEGPLPPTIPLYGAGVMTCAGDIITRGGSRLPGLASRGAYEALTVVFVFLCAFYFMADGKRARRSPRYALIAGLALVLGSAVGMTGALTLRAYETQLDNLFTWLVTGVGADSQVGFGDEARLGGVAGQKINSSRATALRIESKAAPGYVKGKAYDTYLGPDWKDSEPGARFLSPAPPGPLTPTASPGRNVFTILDAPQGEPYIVWPIAPSQGMFFQPGNAARLSAPFGRIRESANSNLYNPSGEVYEPYTMWNAASTFSSPAPLDSGLRERYLAVPETINGRVRQLAETIFKDAHMFDEKLLTVTNYFQKNYRYQLGISIPYRKDPLTYFLLERPPAHCEYFATGAAILLRLAGVPTRYVTGYVVWEPHPDGKYWLARNADAHAWVEAYDPDQGWVTVEATLAEGIPSAESSRRGGRLAYLLDEMRFRWKKLLFALSERGTGAAIAEATALAAAAVLGLLGSAPGWIILAFLLLLLARHYRKWFKRPAVAAGHAGPSPLSQLLDRMDRRLRREGLVRRPHETLRQFAKRVTESVRDREKAERWASWYNAYAQARFDRPSENRITQLRQDLEDRVA